MHSIIKEAMDLEYIKFKARIGKILGKKPSPEIDFLIKRAYEQGMSEEDAAMAVKTGGASLEQPELGADDMRLAQDQEMQQGEEFGQDDMEDVSYDDQESGRRWGREFN